MRDRRENCPGYQLASFSPKSGKPRVKKTSIIYLFGIYSFFFPIYCSFSSSQFYTDEFWYKRLIIRKVALAQIYSLGKVHDPTRPLCRAYATMETNMKAQKSPDTRTTCDAGTKFTAWLDRPQFIDGKRPFCNG